MNDQALVPSDKRHRFPPESIAYAVWRYCRVALRYRDVEELLAERGVIVTYETVRRWCRKFGQTYANGLRRHRPRPGDKWHLDEVFISINGEQHYLWRAVDQDGQVLDILVQPRRDAATARRFFRKLLKGLPYVPRVVVTDKLASYGAAKRDVLPSVEHRRHKGLNNRAENSHQPTRERERRMAWACPAVPRGLRADRQPLPPAPPPPDRRSLSPDENGTLRHLAGGHRHPGHGLIPGGFSQAAACLRSPRRCSPPS